MHKYLNLRMSDELLAALDAFAAERNISRSEAARLAFWRMLNAPEPYLPPTLPNWQVEAWTSLLRGVFGDERLALTDEIKPMLAEAVANLNEREARVLRLRFGLGGPCHTLAEVAKAFGWADRQRAYQVEARALKRVRGWCRRAGIWELVGKQLLDEGET